MTKTLAPSEGTGTTSYTYTTDSSSTATVDKAANCMSWVKYGIILGNIVYLLVGGLILALGVWLRTDSRFRNFLSERYRQAVEEAFWEAPTLYTFSYIMIVLGCCMIVVAFFGFCGTATRSRALLIIYAMMVFVLMIATLASGIYLYYKRDGLDVEVSDALNYMVQHYYQGAGVVQESLDHLQMTFRCCGNAGCSDFRVFRQDPPRSCDIRCDGCHYRIMVALHIGYSVALVVFACVVLIQVLGIALTLYTSSSNATNSIGVGTQSYVNEIRLEMGNDGDVEQGTSQIVDNQNVPDFEGLGLQLNGEAENGDDSGASDGGDAADTGTQQLRASFNRLRQSIEENRQAQSLIYAFCTSVIPFVMLFLTKATLDFAWPIARFLIAYSIFLFCNSNVQIAVSGGRTGLCMRLALLFAFIITLSIWQISAFKLDEFSYSAALSLDFQHFLSSDWPVHGFLYTLYSVMMCDVIVKHITAGLKLVVALSPFEILAAARKRRAYQLIEYASQTYRDVVPFLVWTRYFIKPGQEKNFYDGPLELFYFCIKVRELYHFLHLLIASAKQFRNRSNCGTDPTRVEIEAIAMCAICHEKLFQPTKLTCSHIFCQTCIETWLDSNDTCPMCRTVVERQDNSWKSGATSKNIRLY
ncbi:hypothetical protein WR25_09192 [Diploscapter pachys]|uniref:RING-type domain-containing protein n=1 Tax=Diploscapter pachys TaxID=2018661 RepID=A0A2A2LYA2_9BILA|nr:hypothetical protein WR25_09192 [Diploscapter pachys]